MDIAFEVRLATLTPEQRPGWDQSMQILTELLGQAIGFSVSTPAPESELACPIV
jgi:hypothetical protein